MQDETNQFSENGSEKKGRKEEEHIAVEKDEPVESKIAAELFPNKEEKILKQPKKKKENLAFDIAALLLIVLLAVILYYYGLPLLAGG